MNAYLVGAVVAGAAIAFVAAPLLRRSRGAARPGSDTLPPGARPETAASPIDEIELDLAMGKLTREDYERLRRGDAAANAAPISSDSRDDTLPTPSRVAAAAAEARPGDLAEAMIRAERGRAVSCGTCGPRPEPAARFCSHCGRSLNVCRACGAVDDGAGGRYCTACGAPTAG